MKLTPKYILFCIALVIAVVLLMSAKPDYLTKGQPDVISGCKYIVWSHGQGLTAVHAGDCTNYKEHKYSNQ